MKNSPLASFVFTALAVMFMTASAKSQKPHTLKPGVAAEVVLGSDRKTKLTLVPRAKRLVRVLVAAADGAAKPTLTVARGRNVIKPSLTHFEKYTVIEWPAVRAGSVTITLRGKKSGDRYTVKYATATIPVSKANGGSPIVPIEFVLSHTAWARTKVKAKAPYELVATSDDDGKIQTTVRSAGGTTIRHKPTDSWVEWTAKKSEVLYLELRAARNECRYVKLSVRAPTLKYERINVQMMPGDRKRIEEPPPLGSAWPHEATVRVGKAEPGTYRLDFEPEHVGKTFVVEAIGTSLKDPTMWIRDEGGALLKWDDDSGDGSNAKIRVKVPKEGELQVCVRSFQSGLSGEVTLRWQPE